MKTVPPGFHEQRAVGEAESQVPGPLGSDATGHVQLGENGRHLRFKTERREARERERKIAIRIGNGANQVLLHSSPARGILRRNDWRALETIATAAAEWAPSAFISHAPSIPLSPGETSSLCRFKQDLDWIR